MGTAAGKSKEQAINSSTRLLLHPSPQLSKDLTKCTSYAVTGDEIHFLAKLFSDLASRSTGETMDKETFLRFFALPVSAT